MSEFVSELKASWLGVRQNEFHQSTRGIMTPEERQALEEEFDRKLAERDRQVSERAWDEGVNASVAAIAESHGTISYIAPHNPYRKERDDDCY